MFVLFCNGLIFVVWRLTYLCVWGEVLQRLGGVLILMMAWFWSVALDACVGCGPCVHLFDTLKLLVCSRGGDLAGLFYLIWIVDICLVIRYW